LCGPAATSGRRVIRVRITERAGSGKAADLSRHFPFRAADAGRRSAFSSQTPRRKTTGFRVRLVGITGVGPPGHITPSCRRCEGTCRGACEPSLRSYRCSPRGEVAQTCQAGGRRTLSSGRSRLPTNSRQILASGHGRNQGFPARAGSFGQADSRRPSCVLPAQGMAVVACPPDDSPSLASISSDPPT